MLGELNDAFTDRIQEIRGFLHLRLEDKSKGLFQQELVGLEANVRALEQHVAHLKAFLKQEDASVSKVQALLEACRLQNQDIQGIESSMPPHVQTAMLAADTKQATQLRGGKEGRDQSKSKTNSEEEVNATQKKKKPVPRWYVTEAELASISSYMRGRVTLEKINAAVDEMAKHAEMNNRLITTIRAQPSKLAPAERKRATDLLHSVAGKEGFKGRFWFQECDLGRDGEQLKLDKTGKAMMTMMRHLGRVQEVRQSVAATNTVLYILNQQS